MKNKIKFTVKCLMENKLRFILTVLSITVGVVSILIVNSISSYGVQAVSTELNSLGMNGLSLSIASDDVILSENEIEKVSGVCGIDKCAPATVNTSVIYGNNADDETNTVVWGIDERMPEVISFDLMYGRYIDKGDIKSHNRVCIVDQSLADQVFGMENVVGKNIKLLCDCTVEDFEVVGVVKTGRGIMQSLMGNYFPAFLYVPYSAFGNTTFYNQVFLKLDGTRPSDETAKAVETVLTNKGSAGGYVVTDMAGQKSVLDSMLNIVTAVLTVIGAISLLVSSLSIMNIMLISVNERIKEIGIKKSIGATGTDIMLDFLTESFIISAVGAILGILVTFLLIKAASFVLSIDISLNIIVVVGALCVSVVLGIVFGIFPAYKASKFRPVEALRR